MHHRFRQSLAKYLVVEPSPIRGLAADCPILIIFKLSHFGLFHPYVVVNKTLRVFQQFNAILTYITI